MRPKRIFEREPATDPDGLYHLTLQECRDRLLRESLERNAFNLPDTARELGIETQMLKRCLASFRLRLAHDVPRARKGLYYRTLLACRDRLVRDVFRRNDRNVHSSARELGVTVQMVKKWLAGAGEYAPADYLLTKRGGNDGRPPRGPSRASTS